MTSHRKNHLAHIKVEGFKSIKQLDLAMRSVNVLIGANGAGKSNFISIFTFLRYLSEGRLQHYVERHGFANTFFHFGTKQTAKIVFDLTVNINGYHVEFKHGINDDTLVFDHEYCTIEDSSRKFTIKGIRGESGLLPDGEADSIYVRNFTRDYLQQCKVYHFHDTGPAAGFKQAQPVCDNTFLAMDARNIGPFLKRIQDESPQSYREIVKTVQVVAPFFRDFYLQPQGAEGSKKILLRWLHKHHDTPFSANQLSDGMARFICLTTLFLQPEHLRPETTIIDEPELGLHPVALEVLADMIKLTAAKAAKNQVICSTQSIAFANHFEPEDCIVADQEKGVSVFRRLEREDLEDWLDEYGVGDLWDKNLVGGRPEW